MLYDGVIWLPWKHILRYFSQCMFCMVHSICPINVCANFENKQNRMFYLTSRDAKTVCHSDLLPLQDVAILDQ